MKNCLKPPMAVSQGKITSLMKMDAKECWQPSCNCYWYYFGHSFAASTAYSGMRAGLTVAAGIPGAILGSGLLSIFIRKNNFLMKNILQSMATGGESIASGLIFVLPAVILIGQQVSFFEGVIVGVSAVLVSLGILSFVQDYLLVEEHGTLVYPEAMAISETLVASSTGGNSLKYMGIGFGVGGLITAFTSAVLVL